MYVYSQSSCPSLYFLSPRNLYRTLQIVTVAHRIKSKILLGPQAFRVQLLLTLHHHLIAFLTSITPSQPQWFYFSSLNMSSPSSPTDFACIPSSTKLSPLVHSQYLSLTSNALPFVSINLMQHPQSTSITLSYYFLSTT